MSDMAGFYLDTAAECMIDDNADIWDDECAGYDGSINLGRSLNKKSSSQSVNRKPETYQEAIARVNRMIYGDESCST